MLMSVDNIKAICGQIHFVGKRHIIWCDSIFGSCNYTSRVFWRSVGEFNVFHLFITRPCHYLLISGNFFLSYGVTPFKF